MFKIQFVQDFFELRRLRRDLRTADAVHLQQTDEIAQLKKDIARHKTSYNELAEASKKSTQKLRADLAKTRKLVREQTAADMLVISLRELGVLPADKKDDRTFKQLQRQLHRTDQALQQARRIENRLSCPPDALGSGLNGIFGV